MKPTVDYTLYLVAGRDSAAPLHIAETVELAVTGGCTVVQLREKNISSRAFYNIATRVKEVTDGLNVPFIVNDRADIAVAVGADGVHVGQDDLPAHKSRRLLGPDKILGVSCSTREEALTAVRDGADYLGVGAMNPTTTKADATVIGIEELVAIREAVSCPIVAIGGINKATIHRLKGTGIDGAAVASAIAGQKDVAEAARELKTLCEQYCS